MLVLHGRILKRTLSYIENKKEGIPPYPKITYTVQGVDFEKYKISDFSPPVTDDLSQTGKPLPDREQLLEVDSDRVIQIKVQTRVYMSGNTARLDYSYMRDRLEEEDY
ncbi:MAG: hypothetical protein B6245_03450 [Desulfobacteraceae bacterium 4572_88]|nr:MAG: hypothetical protein B6245_03450 [Desulfobacteraceae bacterium 4572_88]